MDDEQYYPNVFFAFQADILKCDARAIIAPVVMQYFHVYNNLAVTPWKINLFHIAEFESYSTPEIPEAIKKLKLINGRTVSKPQEITCMSSHDIALTRYKAISLLNDNPLTQKVVDVARDMGLNYIIQGVYEDRTFTRVNYRSDDKAYQALTGIVARLVADKKITIYSKNFNRHFYAYNENGEPRFVFS